MREETCSFGPDGRLAGIVTFAETSPSRAVRALVLVSAGLTPKAGPFRLYAQLARRMATEGFVTLRFDLSGIGVSGRNPEPLPLRERTHRDLEAALDFLAASHGMHEFILGGLCSGAEDAFRHAERDPRVAGVVMIDPFAYRTAGWRWRDFMGRARRRGLRTLGIYQPHAPPVAASGASRLVRYKYMEPPESGRILGLLLAAKKRVHFVYTGGAAEHFNHEGQLAAMFPQLELRGRVTLDHLPALDHTQLLASDRAILVEVIRARMVAAYT